MAVILTVVHVKYIVPAACAFIPIDANEAAFQRNNVFFFLPVSCTNIVMILLGIKI